MASNSIKQRISFIRPRASIVPIYALGFTLIELIITVAVVAVLATLAYPVYDEQIRQSRRANAQGALQAFAIAMERYFTEQVSPSYVNTTSGNSGTGPGAPESTVFPSKAPLDGARKYYDLVVQAAGLSSYELRAEPIGIQAGDKCGTYTLLSTGIRGITDVPTDDVTWQDCWK